MILVWLEFIISDEHAQNTHMTHVHKGGIMNALPYPY